MKQPLKAAVISSKGIGDGLIMMVASHNLSIAGYEVTTFQDSLQQLSPFFPNHHFGKRSDIQSDIMYLEPFDLIILQNDNSTLSFKLIEKYRHKLAVFYSSYDQEKHIPLDVKDQLLSRRIPLVHSVATATASLLKADTSSKSNGMKPPSDLTHRKYSRRILIHPTSTSLKRTYPAAKFLKVAKLLKQKGYEIAFCVSPQEREAWSALIKDQFLLPQFPTLKELATYIYESHFLIGNESGTGHLASNLQIPTLIVASCPKQMALWRPGFLIGKVVTPPSFIPNIKGLRLRQNHWHHFITPKHIVNETLL